MRGEFGKQLMAERSLSQLLGVSCATLRAALGKLEAEGVLRKSGSRCEREVLARRRVPKAPSAYRVRLLQSGNMACDRGKYLRLVRGLSEHLKEDGISFRVETHLSCFSNRPSRALEHLVNTVPADLTVATHLARRGIRAGEDISLICRNADPFFASMTPSVAHYRRNTRQFQRHLSQLIRGLMEHRALPLRRTLIPSTFEDGDSLRKATAR